MKKRYGFICLGLSLVLLFSGCNNSKKYEDDVPENIKETESGTLKNFSGFAIDTDTEPYQFQGGSQNSFMAVTEDGIYYRIKFLTSELFPWHFYNVHTGDDTVLCSKVDCEHKDSSTCEAFFNNYHYYGNYEDALSELEEENAETNFVYYNNRLYAVKYDYIDGTKIVSYDSMGNDMKVEAVVEEDPSYILKSPYILKISNGKCMLHLSSYKEKVSKLVAVSLSDGKSEMIYSRAIKYIAPDAFDYMSPDVPININCMYDGVYFFSVVEGTEYILYGYDTVTGKLDTVLNFKELAQVLKENEKITQGTLFKDGKIWFTVYAEKDGWKKDFKNGGALCSYDLKTKEFRRMDVKVKDGIIQDCIYDVDDRYIYVKTSKYLTAKEISEAFSDGKLGKEVKLPGIQVYDINTFELLYECEFRNNVTKEQEKKWTDNQEFYSGYMSQFYDQVLTEREAEMIFMGLDDRYVYFSARGAFDPIGKGDTTSYKGCIGLRIDSISEQNPEWVWLWRE